MLYDCFVEFFEHLLAGVNFNYRSNPLKTCLLITVSLLGCCLWCHAFGEDKVGGTKIGLQPAIAPGSPTNEKLKKASDALDAERLSKSLASWTKAKVDCGGNYSYKVIISSFTGHRAETTIVVKENKVVERKLETGIPNFLGKPAPLKLEWMETGKDIGSHTKTVEPRTLDELYMIAKKIVEQDVPTNHVRSLGIDKQGLLQHCFIRDTRIQDDAPLTGVPAIYLTLEKK